MAFIDYYKTLGVDKNAKPEEIKSAYRKLARKFHPDLNADNKDAKKKFQEINEANEVLSDPGKRQKYDEYGSDWQHAEQYEKSRQSNRQSANRSEYTYADSGNEGGFSDFFESMFGNSNRNRQVKFRGQDYNAEVQLNLVDAYKTHSQTLTVNAKNIRITVPAGIENGQVIRISGYGAPGINGGPSGDLYIKFLISNDQKFRRSGNDLYTTVDLNLYTAVLGGEITVDTLDGKVKLRVKPETQIGEKIKLKGKGFPIYKKDGQFGDLYITYSVKIPTNLTENQKALFVELAKS
ncbi:MAG: J domain-containing protein [Chitinophagales bacterium]|nr:J domain-containing protein [Chitinophagales bacterium]